MLQSLNKWWLNGPYTHLHIFIWTLTSMCDLDLGRKDLNLAHDTPPHNVEHLCQVILKSLYTCGSFAPDKHFSMSSKCDLDLWPRDLVHVRDTAPHSGEHFYEVSLKSLHTCRRYAPDKIGRRPPARPTARQGRSHNTSRFSNGRIKINYV